MTTEQSRKIYVAGGMAAILAIVAVAFTLRAKPAPQVALAPEPPAQVTPAQVTPALPVAPSAPVAAVPEATAPAVAVRSAPKRPAARAQPGTAATAIDTPPYENHLAEVTPIAAPVPAGQQSGATSGVLPALDTRITSEVEFEIAADSIGKTEVIGVTTTQGVVALSGTLVSQDAVDHIKDLVGKVRDVKSIDATALTIAQL